MDLAAARGREVIIWPDADEDGGRAMNAVGRNLRGLAASVKMVPVEDLSEGCGAADIPAGVMAGLIAQAAPWTPPPGEAVPEGRSDGDWSTNPFGDARRMLLAHGTELLAARNSSGAGERATPHLLDAKTGHWRQDTDTLTLWHYQIAAARHEASAQRAMDAGDDQESKHWRQVARYFNQAQQPAAADKAAASLLPAMTALSLGRVVDDSGLDANLRFLGVGNGAVDLENGELTPPERCPDLLITKAVRTRYAPGATHPAVDRLTAHLPPELAQFLWASLGFALHGRPERRFCLIVGPKGGGKSTLMVAVRETLGPHIYGAIPADALRLKWMSRGNAGLSPELMTLMTRRVGSVAELTGRADAAFIKAATGDDLIQWRLLYQRSMSEGVPTCSIYILANGGEEPRLGLTDSALADRLVTVPYPGIPPEKRDPGLRNVFRSDPRAREAVLAALVRGAVKHQPDNPPRLPEEVRRANRSQREKDMTPAEEFAATLVYAPGNYVASAEVWAAFCGYMEVEADQNGKLPRSVDGIDAKKLTQAIVQRFSGGDTPGIMTRQPMPRNGKTLSRGYKGIRMPNALEYATDMFEEAAVTTDTADTAPQQSLFLGKKQYT